jgi:hypothetical protein
MPLRDHFGAALKVSCIVQRSLKSGGRKHDLRIAAHMLLGLQHTCCCPILQTGDHVFYEQLASSNFAWSRHCRYGWTLQGPSMAGLRASLWVPLSSGMVKSRYSPVFKHFSVVGAGCTTFGRARPSATSRPSARQPVWRSPGTASSSRPRMARTSRSGTLGSFRSSKPTPSSTPQSPRPCTPPSSGLLQPATTCGCASLTRRPGRSSVSGAANCLFQRPL